MRELREQHVDLISAVSGGSVGAMYFINEFTEAGPPARSELGKILERAEGSSLDKIAWGLIYSISYAYLLRMALAGIEDAPLRMLC